VRTVAIAVLAAASAGGLFLTCFERKTYEVEVGRSQEARRNRYLALGRMLDRMGHETVTHDGPSELLEWLPPSDGTLFLPTHRRTLSRQHNRRLLDWVESGGHLIVVTYSLWDDPEREPDELLDRFGLEQQQRQSDVDSRGEPQESGESGGGKAVPDADESEDEQEESGWDVAQAHWPGVAEPLQVAFDQNFYWKDTGRGLAVWHVAGNQGIYLITLAHGAGRITASTDDFFLSNDYAGDHDHAELAVRLARMGDRTGPVWIVFAEEWPGLWSQLRKYATPVVLSLALLIAIWLWRASLRFGPLRPAPPGERRRWMEHLEAVGRYHWRHDRGRTLIEAARASVTWSLMRRRPGWARLSPRARAQHLAELTGLSDRQAAAALDESVYPRDENHFVTTIARLERIRKAL
jgi:hypothetical protein